MTLYKTIASAKGGTKVAMTADEESEFVAGQATAQEAQAIADAKAAEPSEIEVRLSALEAKVGITEDDKAAAQNTLMAATMGVKQ